MIEEYLVFTGRPNAGKSSIIRKITGLDAASGKRPGTTRRISKYPLSKGLSLIDMPGFGRMMGSSRSLEERVKDQILEFIESEAGNIALAVHVLDISTFIEVTRRLDRKGFISVDVEMIQFLRDMLNENPIVAANKIDKIGKEKLKEEMADLRLRISKGHLSAVSEYVFPVSASMGLGLGLLKGAIHDRLVAKGFRAPFER
jgi:GTP-binding protein EngB required for normal cell division